MRLIDADALNPKFVHGRWDDRYVSEKEVQDAPTVEPIKVGDVCKDCWRDGGNVVEVVRCKDCRHRDPEDHKCDSGEMERQGCPFKVADDYFCAYGER